MLDTLRPEEIVSGGAKYLPPGLCFVLKSADTLKLGISRHLEARHQPTP